MKVPFIQNVSTAVTAGLTYPYSEIIANNFTRKSRFGDIVKLYKKRGDTILIPWNCGKWGEDKRITGQKIKSTSSFVPTDAEQQRVVNACTTLLLNDESHILHGGTGIGKCHGIDTPVLMYSGSVRVVQDVVPGDLVMGDDSTPRKVLEVHSGFGEMYEVKPVKGGSFTCNSEHILRLRHTSTKKEVELSIKDYLKKSNKFKHCYKLYRTGVDFEDSAELPIDPYFLGVLLGDGGLTIGVNVTTVDAEILNVCESQASIWGLELKSRVSDASPIPTYAFVGPKGGNHRDRNQLWAYIQYFGLNFKKFIPFIYKTGSREVRLQVLAGLIDTDGSLCNGCFDFVSKYKQLAEDTVFVARSLGLAAYSKKVEKKCYNNGVVGVYYRVSVSGDIRVVPTKLKRKQASKRKQKKDVLVTGLKITRIPDGAYYGFSVDQNHLYLLGDFTVTHNSYIGAEVIGNVGVKTLIIIPKEDIIEQWVKALKEVLNLKDNEIGLIQGDSCSVAGKKVVIAMVHSICKDGRYPAWVYKEFGFVVIDEVQVMGAETFSDAMWKFPAKLRLGLTATPYRMDGKDFVFFSHIGSVQVVSADAPLVPKIIVRRSSWQVPTIKVIEVDGKGRKLIRTKQLPHKAGKCMHIHKLLAGSEARNDIIINFVFQAYKKGRRTIVFSELKDAHLVPWEIMLLAKGVPKRDIGWYAGKMSKQEIEQTKLKPIILATYGKAAMATNIPWLDTCVFGTPRSDVEQILGRILREYPDKFDPIALDMVDEDSEVYLGYYHKRLVYYSQIGAEVIQM